MSWESSCIRCRTLVQWLSLQLTICVVTAVCLEKGGESENDVMISGGLDMYCFCLISNFQFICVLSDHKWHSLGQLLPGISEGRRGDGTQWQTTETEGGHDKSEKYAHRISDPLCSASYLISVVYKFTRTSLSSLVLEILPVQVVDLR